MSDWPVGLWFVWRGFGFCFGWPLHLFTILRRRSVRAGAPRRALLGEEEALVAAGRMPLFDAAASYLALQHEGFGRHGELLSPLADLQLMARVWCITKPLALMLLSVPVGADYIHWKIHRVYGRTMLPHLLANWHARVLRSERQGMRTISPPLLLLQRLDPEPTHGPNATSTNAGGPYR